MERYKIGDKVKVVKAREDIGDFFKQLGAEGIIVGNIDHIDADYEIRFPVEDNDYWYYASDEIELIEQFKVGDRVKVLVHSDTIPLNQQIGRCGKVTDVEILSDERSYLAVILDGEETYWYYKFVDVEIVEEVQTSISDEDEDKSWAYTNEDEPDKVNPPHYKKGSVECIDAIKAATVGKSGFEGYLVGNCVKYLWRFEDKGGVEDLKKGAWYLNKLIDERTV